MMGTHSSEKLKAKSENGEGNEIRMKDEMRRGILWGNSIKPMEVIENKEYNCAHTPSTAKV